MASTDTGSQTGMPEAGTVDMALEVVTLPVADVDRAKSFYQSLGWWLTLTGTRVPAITAWPCITPGSVEIIPNWSAVTTTSVPCRK